MNAKPMTSRFSWASDFPWLLGVILVVLSFVYPVGSAFMSGWGLIFVGCLVKTREVIIAKLDEMDRRASASAQHAIRKELKEALHELQDKGE